MSLASAIAALPTDSRTERMLHETLVLLKRRGAQWTPPEELRRAVALPGVDFGDMLVVLERAGVVECQAEPPGYRLRPDVVVTVDVARYIERVDVCGKQRASSLEQFRNRYRPSAGS